LPATYAGRPPAAAIDPASRLVVETRLSRSSRAQRDEWGLPAVGEPARLTTTSAAATASSGTRPSAGCHSTSSAAPGARRTSRVTV
jgi:hypothetical protein